MSTFSNDIYLFLLWNRNNQIKSKWINMREIKTSWFFFFFCHVAQLYCRLYMKLCVQSSLSKFVFLLQLLVFTWSSLLLLKIFPKHIFKLLCPAVFVLAMNASQQCSLSFFLSDLLLGGSGGRSALSVLSRSRHETLGNSYRGKVNTTVSRGSPVCLLAAAWGSCQGNYSFLCCAMVYG